MPDNGAFTVTGKIGIDRKIQDRVIDMIISIILYSAIILSIIA